MALHVWHVRRPRLVGLQFAAVCAPWYRTSTARLRIFQEHLPRDKDGSGTSWEDTALWGRGGLLAFERPRRK